MLPTQNFVKKCLDYKEQKLNERNYRYAYCMRQKVGKATMEITEWTKRFGLQLIAFLSVVQRLKIAQLTFFWSVDEFIRS